ETGLPCKDQNVTAVGHVEKVVEAGVEGDIDWRAHAGGGNDRVWSRIAGYGGGVLEEQNRCPALVGHKQAIGDHINKQVLRRQQHGCPSADSSCWSYVPGCIKRVAEPQD